MKAWCSVLFTFSHHCHRRRRKWAPKKIQTRSRIWRVNSFPPVQENSEVKQKAKDFDLALLAIGCHYGYKSNHILIVNTKLIIRTFLTTEFLKIVTRFSKFCFDVVLCVCVCARVCVCACVCVCVLVYIWWRIIWERQNRDWKNEKKHRNNFWKQYNSRSLNFFLYSSV